MFKKSFLIIHLLILLLLPGFAQAVTVAVFPVEDLSRGKNGVNFPLMDFLSQRLVSLGFDVIPSDRLISFMARKRMRELGFIDSSHLFLLRDELDVDFALVGTISQQQETPFIALGLVFTVIRTDDARTVWTRSQGVSCSDFCNFLGLNQPGSINSLLPLLADEILKEWPSEFPEKKVYAEFMQVESTRLDPQYLRAGEEVRCSVKIRSSTPLNDKGVDVKLMVGDDNYLPMYLTGVNAYEAKWPAPSRDGAVPVSLVITGAGLQKVTYVGSYHIDNSASKLVLDVKGEEVRHNLLFSRSLPVFPKWQDPEPLSGWHFFVQNSNGETIVSLEEKGDLPKRLLWKGLLQDGHTAPDGSYQLFLKVWDRAGNDTLATRNVELRNNPPVPLVHASSDFDSLFVSLDTNGLVPISFWSSEILYSDGQPAMSKQGTQLPIELRIPQPSSTDNRKIEIEITMQDILGNISKKKIKDIMELVKPTEKVVESPKIEEWVAEF